MTLKLEIDAFRKKWYTIDAQTVLDNLETSEDGLSAEEAAVRLKKFGYNKLPEQKKPGFLRRFFIYFHNVLIYILIVAAIITALMDHWIDTWVILSVVFINALIGYIQENKAEKALESIRHMLSLHAAVFRDGKRKDLEAENLVPGDIVFLSSGDKIPADVRILQANSFKVEEAALTGESEAVTKNPAPVSEDATLGDRRCMAYSGTTVRYGNATGVVVATGSSTELGKINTMIAETEEMTTPLIRKINSFGKWLSAVIVVLAAVFFAFGYFARDYDLNELFLAVIGLTVAAIPEGLPAILTITLAIGVQRMARRNAIIRKLPSVETLGSVTVICSDKTGTLTRNEMTARLLFTSSGQYKVDGVGYAPEGKIIKEGAEVDLKSDPLLSRFMQAVSLCNNAEVSKDDEGIWEMKGAPTEGALKTLAYKAGLPDDQAKRLHTIPFDSEYKYMATLNQVGDEHLILINGAPDRLLDICEKQLTDQGEKALERDYWEKQIEVGGRRGLMLGSAFRQVEPSLQEIDHDDLRKGLIFLGLVGIIDPPRPEAIAAISECKEAGIKVKMITGDHAVTAMTIGNEMGIGDGEKAITGAELEKMDDIKMREVVQEYDIFARTSPEHKLRLVRALQYNGAICAMTGDGVNDAPALKQADIGIAMGIKGTEVTKDAASMVLADDNFASIVNAVEEGRTIYDNHGNDSCRFLLRSLFISISGHNGKPVWS
ncbi:MAG: HAD-IC family P-type ATPase [Bacillota bacterium]|nr:HAD-IC family P-type ATPase [Bacillota bacterium]